MFIIGTFTSPPSLAFILQHTASALGPSPSWHASPARADESPVLAAP